MDGNAETALQYETKMFHKFITCLFDNSYISHMGLDMLYFFKINSFYFCKALLDPVFHVIDMQIFDFKNSIITIQLFLVMILNLYFSSAWF